MSALRAHLRRQARLDAHEPEWPVVPGLLPDLSAESQQWALEAAHEHLPTLPNTFVQVVFFDLDEGLAKMAAAGWADTAITELRVTAENKGTPFLVLATRRPHENHDCACGRPHRTLDIVDPTAITPDERRVDL